MIRVLDIIEDTMVDGPGFRTSIYCAGCNHQCPGCHNPQSWDFGGGREMTTAALMKIIMADPFANVTFSGGDPMYQADYESLINDEQRELLEQLDVLVDGPFIQKLSDPDLLFRGSSNQRLIDVQKTLYAGEVILWQPNVDVKEYSVLDIKKPGSGRNHLPG